MKTTAFRLLPGVDLKKALLDYCIEQKIEAACVLGCVGSLRNAVLRFAGCRDGATLDGKLEILSLSGTLSRHGCHLHIALADHEGKVTGGHLMDGSCIHTTAEIVLAIIPDAIFKREHDPLTGHKELRIDGAAAP
jgi:predicted DNA-binding protein with PD1-like motif